MRPLTRAERRAAQREARRQLAGYGCTCRPKLLPPENLPDGVAYGCNVQHEHGCRFGDRVLTLSTLGLGVVVYGPTRPGCER